MVQIDWLDGLLDVRRIVLGWTMAEAMNDKFRRVAALKGLTVSGEDTEARKGDLWVGCIPRNGWTEVRSGLIGLVQPSEVALVLTLAQLRRASVLSGELPQEQHLAPQTRIGDYAQATALESADL